ncbi:MAG: ATP-binding protein, partial [Acidobacteria bacterium]|nr:ATP-binding protein [Acidobacteriota bacterium]
MPPLIKDYVEFRKVDYLRAVTSSSFNDCIRTFLPTDGLLELLSRILESISKKIGERSKSLQEPSSILLTGGHGVGKSHLLSVIFNLISQKGPLNQGFNDPRVHSNITAVREMEPLCIWIDLAEQTDVSLPELVLAKIHAEYQHRFNKQVIDPVVIPGIGTIKAHELITFNIAAERPILLVVDGLAKRAQSRDVQGLNADIEFLSFMGYSSKTARFFLIVAAHEDFFSPKSPLGIDSTLMAQTLENFKIEWIDRASVKEIIGRHIFRKNQRQQQDVRKLHAFIKAKLPNFQYSENDFCDAYPFHPLIFDVAEKIRSKVSTFSLLDFVCTVYPKVASHRAVSLITIENVFDRVEYELRTGPQCQRLYLIYQGLAERAVPRLQDRYRLWGKMLLKATCLFTLADRNPSVRDLADALLLFEDSEGLSYNMVGMLLGQMEKAVEQGFTTTDDRLDRTYRLGAADMREELNKYLASIASQIPDADARLAEILPAAAPDIFPDWRLGRELAKHALRETPVLQAFWRGTERLGCVLFSERFSPARAHDPDEPTEIAQLARWLPAILEPFQPSEPAEAAPVADKPARELEWLLWMEPIGLSPEVQATLKPFKPTEVHW